VYSLIIADDEPENLAGLCSIVRWSDLGFELKAAFPSGEEARKYLLDHECDVLFTDIVMEGVSGLDLAAWLREHRPEVRVVLISAYPEFDYAQKAIETRAFRYLLKPTRVEDLVQTFLELRQTMDAESKYPPYPPEAEPGNRIVGKIREYVGEHLNEPISLTAMAQAFHYNSSYLSRVFKAECGEGINEYVNRMRIERARKLLERSDMKIYEVARAVGFRDIRYFTRQFTAIAGEKPSAYRKRRPI